MEWRLNKSSPNLKKKSKRSLPNDGAGHERDNNRSEHPMTWRLSRRLSLPEPVKVNPDQWKEIGREENDRLDYEPAKIFVRRTIRPKFVHKVERDRPPLIAPAPEEISVGGKAAAGLLAKILVNRYCDHQAYFRQQAMLARAEMGSRLDFQQTC